MKRKKNNIPARILAWIIAIAMAFCLLPVNMWETEATTTLKNPSIANGVTTWDCVWFGSYPQSSDGDGGFVTEPIKWRVLSVDGNDAFLLADQSLDSKPYNEKYINVTWEICTLRQWLNDNFMDVAFKSLERRAIEYTTVVNADYYDTDGGNDTEDQVYLLSIGEVCDEYYGFSSSNDNYDKARRAENTEYAKACGAYTSTSDEYYGNSWWRLRSSGYNSYKSLTVSEDGSISSGNVDYNNVAIRPVLHLNLSSDVWSYAGTVSSDGTGNEVASPKKDISEKTATLSATSYTYDGKVKTPSVTIAGLKQGTDFTVSYNNNTNVGTATVTITGIGNYTGTMVKNFTITKGSQTISGAAAFTKNYGSSPFSLGATAKTKLSYKSSNPDIVTVSSDGIVTLKKAGTVKITVTAAESAQYRSTSKTVTITVGKGNQNISARTSLSKTYGSKPFSLGASAKTKLTYKTSNKKIATVSSDGKVTLKNPGKVKITVKAAETGKYKAASKKVNINVKLKTPTLKAKVAGKKKVKLSWSKVPGATKYEVHMYDAKKKKFVKKITKLAIQRTAVHKGMTSGKTYQYKVRAYKVVDGKKVYSAFSKVKKVKTK